MESEVLTRFQAFSLSVVEKQGVVLIEDDVKVGLKEAERSLIGRVFGEKKANLVGVKSTMMKIWQHRGLYKVVALDQNVFQFVFKEEGDREGIMQGRPWHFDNQLMVLHPWTEGQSWTRVEFNISPIWIQVWNILYHWFSVETGKKIGKLIGPVHDVLLVEAGGKEGRHVKLLVAMDLTKPLVRGTTLKYNQTECWIDFKYERLPIFCFYCGILGHNEKGCSIRRKDVDQDCVNTMQYGYWLRAGYKRKEGLGNKELWNGREDKIQDVLTSMPLWDNVGAGGNRRLDGVSKVQDWSTPGQAGVLAEGGEGARTDTGGGEGVEKSGREMCGEGFSMLKEGGQMDTEVGTNHMGRTVLQAASISAAGEGEQAPQEYGERRVLQEGTLEVPSTVPLSDCTNRLRTVLVHQEDGQTISIKGQWKRRARQIGRGLNDKDEQHHNAVDKENLKRGRDDQNGELLNVESQKKGKLISECLLLQKSEVEETSQDWSHGYK